MLRPLVEQAGTYCRVVRVVADGAYDSRKNFAFLGERGVEASIKVRRNSSCRARECPTRKWIVEENMGNPEGWKRSVGYGLRWMTEMAFSAFKRLFREHVMARSLPNMVR
jgi:hypothetical protein